MVVQNMESLPDMNYHLNRKPRMISDSPGDFKFHHVPVVTEFVV